MTVPVTGITPVYGIEYLVEGEPIRHTRAKLERNAAQIEAALLAGGVAAPGAADLLEVSGRVTALEATLQTQPYAKLYGTGTLSLASGTWTAMPLTGAEEDPLNGHSTVTDTSRWTCPPLQGGIYLASGVVGFGGGATGRRFVGIRKNGAEVPQQQSGSPPISSGTHIQHSGVQMLVLTPGDYVEVWGYQDTGSALSVALGSSGFWLVRLYPVAA